MGMIFGIPFKGALIWVIYINFINFPLFQGTSHNNRHNLTNLSKSASFLVCIPSQGIYYQIQYRCHCPQTMHYKTHKVHFCQTLQLDDAYLDMQCIPRHEVHSQTCIAYMQYVPRLADIQCIPRHACRALKTCLARFPMHHIQKPFQTMLQEACIVTAKLHYQPDHGA